MLKPRLKSFKYAVKGVADLIKTQPNARIHFVISIFVIVAGFLLQLSIVEWCIISLTIAMVVAAEAFNTAIEYLTNLVSPDYHPLAGKTKDAAAGAVLLVAAGAAVVGILIFLPKFLNVWFL